MAISRGANMSKLEAELFQVEIARAELIEQVAEERKERDSSTPALRAFAHAMHEKLCAMVHAKTCTFYSAGFSDDPESADWSEPAHAYWLAVARGAVALQTEQGWKVSEPTADEVIKVEPVIR